MNCQAIEDGDVVERYVLGQLNADEQSAFEEHYFSCEPCFEEVQLLQSLQAVTARRPAKVVQMPQTKWIVWSAIAAVLIAGFGLAERWRMRQGAEIHTATTPLSAAPLQLLAHVDPPRYTPSTLRGLSGDEQFRAAMEKYSAGNYTGAAQALSGLESAAARFYLAVADLMTGNVDEAVTQLRSVEAMGETPYLEESRFFLAKALLAKKDAAGATHALEQTIALTGDREAEARRLLDQVRALPVNGQRP